MLLFTYSLKLRAKLLEKALLRGQQDFIDMHACHPDAAACILSVCVKSDIQLRVGSM